MFCFVDLLQQHKGKEGLQNVLLCAVYAMLNKAQRSCLYIAVMSMWLESWRKCGGALCESLTPTIFKAGLEVM